jgi:ACT domain-containing protein
MHLTGTDAARENFEPLRDNTRRAAGAHESGTGLSMQEKSDRIIVTVIGQDRVGIIAGVSTVLADAGVNIVDISQTTLREFFTMILMADMSGADVRFDELKQRLTALGEDLGVRIDVQHEDVFKFMHRV